jgi:hypothetical protein
MATIAACRFMPLAGESCRFALQSGVATDVDIVFPNRVQGRLLNNRVDNLPQDSVVTAAPYDKNSLMRSPLGVKFCWHALSLRKLAWGVWRLDQLAGRPVG